MVRRFGVALLRLHNLTTFAPYGAVTPIPAAERGQPDAARRVWERLGKPSRDGDAEGNADFERAIVEYLNERAVDVEFDGLVDQSAIVNWRWKDKSEFSREVYLIGRDILYDSNHMWPVGGAEIDPEA
jgi:hypothetical protein